MHNQADNQQKETHKGPKHEPGSRPRKRRKGLQQNPFLDLLAESPSKQQKISDEAALKNSWIIPKKSPLSIQISDHSKTNKYYSHKSIQKYIRYLLAKSCPNPMWLSIKRQSQIQQLVFIDIECENSVFYQCLQQESKDGQEACFGFVSQHVCPEKVAYFRQAPFVKQSVDLWDAMLVYDELSEKQCNQHMHNAKDIKDVKEKLSPSLTYSLLKKYQSYILTEKQRKQNLYPMSNLAAYKNYHQMESKPASLNCQEKQIANMILVVDCEMVITSNGFELARTSIMNFEGHIIYDELFKPLEPITSYNTQYSGIDEAMLKDVQKNIKDLHQDLSVIMNSNTILVGHSLENDLHAMNLLHERVIDTSVLFARKNGSKMKLKTLAKLLTGKTIQQSTHCSSEDCSATLQVMRYKIQVEQQLKTNKQTNYHLLTQLTSSNKKCMIIDTELSFLKHRQQYSAISYMDVIDNLPNNILNKLAQQQQTNTDLILTRIRKSDTHQQWEQYYAQINEGLKSVFSSASALTVFFINFQINHNVVVFPQYESRNGSNQKRALCMILVKN